MKTIFKVIVVAVSVTFFFVAGYFGTGYFVKESGNKAVGSTSETTPTESVEYSFEDPPTESLRGSIATMSGEIHWQSRTATESSKLSDIQEVLQGETYSTKEESALFLVFENVCAVDISEKSQVEIVQTLPVNFVFKQTSGNVSYTKIGENPVSIRALSLLIDIGGNTAVSIDSEQKYISVKVLSNTATVAYNDAGYVSHQIKIEEGKTYTFNHGTRKGVLK